MSGLIVDIVEAVGMRGGALISTRSLAIEARRGGGSSSSAPRLFDRYSRARTYPDLISRRAVARQRLWALASNAHVMARSHGSARYAALAPVALALQRGNPGRLKLFRGIHSLCVYLSISRAGFAARDQSRKCTGQARRRRASFHGSSPIAALANSAATTSGGLGSRVPRRAGPLAIRGASRQCD